MYPCPTGAGDDSATTRATNCQASRDHVNSFCTKVLETAIMEVENNPETNSSDQPTTEDTTAVTQEDLPKTNGEATPETLAMPSPAKAR